MVYDKKRSSAGMPSLPATFPSGGAGTEIRDSLGAAPERDKNRVEKLQNVAVRGRYGFIPEDQLADQDLGNGIKWE